MDFFADVEGNYIQYTPHTARTIIREHLSTGADA